MTDIKPGTGTYGRAAAGVARGTARVVAAMTPRLPAPDTAEPTPPGHRTTRKIAGRRGIQVEPHSPRRHGRSGAGPFSRGDYGVWVCAADYEYEGREATP